MKKQHQTDEGFAFAVVENEGNDVVIEVSEEDYQREKQSGVGDDSLLKPGRYRARRGGFLARHPELKIKDRKSA
ncbi:MAG: hypothetical protein M3371_01865 [Acidobacteriota bacterium]|nr:hypothetical protein [Acidobacteriota bacterium]